MAEKICTVYEDAMLDIFGGSLTGYTRRAAAALLHLVDLWSIADSGHTPHVVRSIWELLTSRGIAEHRELFENLLCCMVDEGLGRQLLFQIGEYDSREWRITPNGPVVVVLPDTFESHGKRRS